MTQAVEGAISGLPGLATLRSNSIQGLSVVTATFGRGSDIYRARQLVNERLAAVAGRLPQGTGPPAMTALTSSTSSVLLIGLTSSTARHGPAHGGGLAGAPAPAGGAGVGEVLTYGGDVRSIPHPGAAAGPDPLPHRPQRRARGGPQGDRGAGAGFIDTVNQRITLQTEGQALTPRRWPGRCS